MKKRMRILFIVLAVSLLTISITGCSNGWNKDSGFRVLIPADSAGRPENLYRMRLDRMQAMTGSIITWEYLSSVPKLKKRIAAGDAPEVVLGKVFQASDIVQFAEEGVLLPIEDYINETDTPNLWKLYQEHPQIKAASIAPDGHTYTLPDVREFMPDYLENAIWINKAWLDKLGLKVPGTLDQLKKVLKEFKEKDPNGNGEADEIPLTFCERHPESYPEALLSAWGMSAKFGSRDGWLTIQDSGVAFAPLTDQWREMITYYRELYREGLLDAEVFKYDAEEFEELQLSPTSRVGVFWARENYMANADEYVVMKPLRRNGRIKPAWRVNPTSIGIKDVLVIFNTCKNPQEVLKWADKFYEVEHSIQNAFGEAAEHAAISKTEDGFIWNEFPEETEVDAFLYSCVLSSNMPCLLPEELYGSEILPLREDMQIEDAIYQQYKSSLEKKVWPNPYYTTEEEEKLSKLLPDIHELAEIKLELWVTDAEDLERDWEEYLADMKSMGADEMLSIYQAAYDRYLAGMPK